MSSPESSSGTLKPAGLFEDLWRQLGECHHNALQELEAKVIKLKKERCLDAQRLELFHNRNQQLKEQNKSLQNANSDLEEKLCGGECEQCAILGENLKNSQDQNLRIITKLKNEKKSLEDENRKLRLELQTLKLSMLQHDSSSDQEDSIIPDSPVLHSSLPVASKLKKCRNLQKLKHVRYEEIPLPKSKSNQSLFKEVDTQAGDATQNPGRADVLVPNTCDPDIPEFLDDVNLVAETCVLELFEKHHTKTARTAGKQSPKSPPKNDARSNQATTAPTTARLQRSTLSSTLIQSPNPTSDRSPSLLQRVKRLSEYMSVNQAKRKKEGNEPEVREENKRGTQEDAAPQRTTAPSGSQSSKKEPADVQVEAAQNTTSSQRPSASYQSPTFKKPNAGGAAKRSSGGMKRSPLHDLTTQNPQRQHGEGAGQTATVEPMWSIDPALQLSMYDSEQREDEEEQQRYGEQEDTDCTWVSHSVLHGRGLDSPDRTDNVAGLGAKANDSLDMMFDVTTYGEYNSCSASRLGQSQPHDEDHNQENQDENNDDGDEPDPFDSPSPSKERKSKHPSFAHVAVIRKKDERRKLKGTTCKECEVYYAHLPEEEKQKKLSACSRHRYLYIPPSTPENFWEVGFPSTQTCIERGYIKEEESPEARPRRRQPYNALFSPKRKQQQS